MWKTQRTPKRTRREQRIIDAISAMSPAEIKKIAVKPFDITDATPNQYLNSEKTGAGWTYVQRQELRQNPEGFVYCSHILANKAFFYDDADHREQVYEFNAILSAACKKIPKAVWSLPPLFYHPDKESKSVDDLEPFTECIDAWNKFDWTTLMKVATKKSMKHNYIIYEPLDVFDIPWYTKPPWKVYAADEAQIKKWKYGHPTVFSIRPSNGKYSAGYEIDITKKFNEINGFKVQDIKNGVGPTNYVSGGLCFDPLQTDDFDAIPWHLGAWNAIQDYEAMCESQNSFKQTISSGFMVVGIPADSYNDLKDIVMEKIERARRGRGLTVPTSVEQPMELNWMAIPDADFTVDKADIRKDIIANIGLPERWLYGNPEGALSAADDDRYAVHDEMKYIFYMFVPFIKKLLLYHGIIEKLEDVEIHPPFELQLTEHEKAELMNIKASTAITLSNVLTVNEIRRYVGYDELSDEDLEELAPTEDEYEDEDENSDKKEIKDAVSRFYEWDRLMNELPFNEMVEYSGRARETVNNIRNNIDTLAIELTDSIPLTDSVYLGNELYQIEGLVMPAQIKEYPEHGMTLERSVEEIRKFMQNPLSRREFPLGATNRDDHPEGVEIYEEETIGKVELTDVSELGALGKITIDLNKVRTVLGPNSWIEDYLKNNRQIPTSVALRATPIKIDKNKHYEVKLDVRSFVATRVPRNAIAGGS